MDKKSNHEHEHNHDHNDKVKHVHKINKKNNHEHEHSHNHEHEHSHGHIGHNHSYKNIGVAFVLNVMFSIIEFIGGIITNSVAIMSDAVHDLGDAVSLGVSWGLEKYSKKSPDKKYTYGYVRFSLLAALINSLVLIVGSAIMLYNAIPRLFSPDDVNVKGMIVFAILGIIINGAAVLVVSKGESLNEKAVSWHLLEDVLGWIVVLITSIVLVFVYIPLLDTILSILITLYIIYKVIKNLRAIFKVFLEGAPTGINIEDIEKEVITKTEAIDVHHIHIWTLDGINHYLTAHVVVMDNTADSEIIKIKEDIRNVLKASNIKHVTLEIEFASEECNHGEC